jgi:hypothetical protein
MVWRHHIINPYTGYPATQQLEINVISGNLTSAELDCFSTALMNTTASEALQLRNQLAIQNLELEFSFLNVQTDLTVDIKMSQGYLLYAVSVAPYVFSALV